MTIFGTYRATSGAYGFLTPDGGGEDWFIPPRKGGGAWDGDAVEAEPLEADSGSERNPAQVIRVLRRSHTTVTGILRREGHRWWLDPDDRKLPGPILVTGAAHNAHAGDRAALSLHSWAAETPGGSLAQIFGPSGELSSCVAAILYNCRIHSAFPDGAMEQAAAIPGSVQEDSLSGRLDLRGETVITIDGASSRDYDDAVSLARDPAGHWRLGVHIADVSHYVPADSPLDREAWERGASVYFADRVVPMLPIALSNGICSLNPQVDRLAVSCFITLNAQGEILDHTLAKSVIRSAERMTYEACNVLLAGGDPALAERYTSILPMLQDMAALSGALARRRRARGALFLETNELAIVCNEAGVPTGLGLRQPGPAQSLIEEFMVVANEVVACHLRDAGLPCVYRVHEKPAADKLEALRTALAPLGYAVADGNGGSLQRLVDTAARSHQAVNTLVLRAQMRARYCPENLGHFGLAAPCYCHFTSPIRRYPDLMVHRVLSLALAGDLRGARRLAGRVEAAAIQATQREQAAASAEREIEKRYAARFMADHVGEVFSGQVSGVTRFGLFVTLANGAEGMLPATALPGGGYRYEEETLTLLGPTRAYRLGDPMQVLVASSDPDAGEITLAPDGAQPAPVRPAQKRPKGLSRHRRKSPRAPRGRRRR